MGARLMEVRGRVEYDDEVIHVIAHHMTDATDQLYALSDDMLNAPVARADHVNSPLPSQVGGKRVMNPRDDLPDAGGAPKRGIRNAPNTRVHPRNVRILPNSRDFH